MATKFWNRVEKTDDCWLWQGPVNNRGYGVVRWRGKPFGAHRLTYEWANGPISGDLEVDHLCKVRHCVRPSHMEAVTHLENCHRSSQRKTHANEVFALNLAAMTTTLSGRQICEMFGVAKTRGLDILAGNRWAELLPR